MRIITTRIKAYKFDELSDDAKQKAIEKLYDINVDYDWWDFVYDDAKNIGLELTGFDLDRGNYCEGKFISGAEECAHKIEKEHGESCETYATAKAFLKSRDEIVDTWEKDEHGDFVDEYELDHKLDEISEEFRESLLEDYRMLLKREYEYLTGEESIIETINSNEYEFTEEGELI